MHNSNIKKSDILEATLICPHCNEAIKVDLPLSFSQHAQHRYSMGDNVEWTPNGLEHGGRPKNGSLLVESNAECPACQKGFSATIEIIADTIKAIILDFNRFGYSHPRGKNRPSRCGIVKFSNTWNLTPRRCAAIVRLAEMGVDIYSNTGEYTLLIPHELHDGLYLDIGYLMAQLGDDDFPTGYAGLTADLPGRKYPKRANDEATIYFSESLPDGFRYRVNPL